MENQAEIVALQLWKALGVDVERKPRRESLSVAMLDELDYGLLLVDSTLTVVHKNFVAGKILTRSPLLSLSKGTLSCSTQENKSSLLDAVRKATSQSKRSFLTLRDDTNRLNLVVVPVEDSNDEDRALIKTERLPQPEDQSIIEFAKSRSLSPATSKTLIELANGASIPEIAKKFGIAESTVRSQIKEIREKTGASSIRQLMLEIADLPPMTSFRSTKNDDIGQATSESSKESNSQNNAARSQYYNAKGELLKFDDSDELISRVARFLLCEDLFQEDFSSLKLHRLVASGLSARHANILLLKLNLLHESFVKNISTISHSTALPPVSENLNSTESEWLWKFSKVLLLAIEAFGSQSRAEEWLLKSAHYFRDEKPIDLIRTSFGETIVTEYLERITSGVLA
jgi:putative toxin-antitoxin system antitoxin component (TIGR02293 family)